MQHDTEEGEPQQPPTRSRHIKKRALKNKALSVSFDEKDLRDYVTGFHKRKKKRRKEAQKQQEEALRLKRIQIRKQSKLERELALYGEAPITNGSADNDIGDNEDIEDGEESNPMESISGTKMYESGNMRVTVTTTEISPDNEEDGPSREKTQLEPSRNPGIVKKKQNLGVGNKKSFKKVSKHKRRPKSRSKREKRKGKKSNKR